MVVNRADDRDCLSHLKLKNQELLKIMTAPGSMTRQFKIGLTHPTLQKCSTQSRDTSVKSEALLRGMSCFANAN